MKNTLRFNLVFTTALLIGSMARSQADILADIITDTSCGGTNRNFLRKVSLKSGIYRNVLFNLLHSRTCSGFVRCR